MDNLNRPIVRIFSSTDTKKSFNSLRNSGRIKELGIIPMVNNPTILTNSLSEIYKKEIPRSYYGEIKFDFNWELKLNYNEKI